VSSEANVQNDISMLTVCEILGHLKGVLACSNKLQNDKKLLVEHVPFASFFELWNSLAVSTQNCCVQPM